jgi:hypothetical protein
MPKTLQLRRDSAADWTSNNPTLSEGEIGYETDTGKVKIGDGSTTWTSLDYLDSAIEHSALDNLAFADAGHTGFQAQGDVLDDLNILGANSADGEFLVGTGVGALAWESGDTVRTSIGLGNVENTALSTWAGSTNITTLGTIATVGNITIANGGTIGQAAGPLLTFNDTDDILDLSGCYMTIDTAGNPAPAGSPTLIIQGSANKERFSLRSFGAVPGAGFQGVGAGGTVVSPTQTLADSFLLYFGGGGYDNAGTPALTGNKTLIGFMAEEDFTTTAQGTYIVFDTTAAGTTSRTEKMRLTSDGNLIVQGDVTGKSLILSGSGTATQGAFYSDANWGGLFIPRVAGAEAAFGIRNTADNATIFSITNTGNAVVAGTLTVNGDQTGAADHVFDDYNDIDLLYKWRNGESLPFEKGDILNRDRLLRDTILQLEKRVSLLEK